jgi:hypothetical protein
MFSGTNRHREQSRLLALQKRNRRLPLDMTTIHEILAEFRDAATSNRDMGDKFERLIASFLVTDPLHSERFSDVWLWTEWPGRGNQPDTGIDLVAKERATGEFCAIQCKFFAAASMVERYAHLAPDHLATAASRIDSSFGKVATF